MVSFDVSAINVVAILEVNDEALGLGVFGELLSHTDEGIGFKCLSRQSEEDGEIIHTTYTSVEANGTGLLKISKPPTTSSPMHRLHRPQRTSTVGQVSPGLALLMCQRHDDLPAVIP